VNRRRILTAAAAALPGLARPAIAQAPDASPLRIVVPYPPGGSFSIIARVLVPALTARLRRSVVVENRGGAGGNIGTEAVARSVPDGSALLLWGDGLVSNPSLYRNLPWDGLRDFAPLAMISASTVILLGRPGAPSLAELAAGAGGRRLTYGTAGNGSPGHIAAALFARRTGARLEHVPYRGGGPMLTDLLGGQIDLSANPLPATLPFLQAGSMVALATASERRVPLLPEVPAVAEAVPGFALNIWYGVFAPVRTPPALAAALSEALLEAAADPAVTAALDPQGFERRLMGARELAAFMATEAPRWAEMIAASGAVLD